MRIKSKHYIIISASRRSVWKHPYSSYESAKSELNSQVSLCGSGYGGDWKVEERESWAEVESSKFSSDNDFNAL